MVAAANGGEFAFELHEPGYVRVTVNGKVTPDTLLQVYEAILDQYAGVRRLWDYRAADLTRLTVGDLERIANYAAEREGDAFGLRVALLVSRDVEYGISRIYEVLTTTRASVEISVFRDDAEATVWLLDEQT